MPDPRIKLADLGVPEPPEITKAVTITLYPREIARLQQIGGGPHRPRNTGIVAGIRRLLAMVEDD